jgi:hypothetical protein
MATHALTITYTPAQTLYAFPHSQSLADWTTHRAALTESGSPNTGRYAVSLNDAQGELWSVFSGASQPANWNDAVRAIDLTSTIKGAGAGPVDQRWVSPNFTVTLPNRSTSTITQETPLRLKTGEIVVVAVDFAAQFGTTGDRLALVQSVTTTSLEDITFEILGVDRTLAKVRVSDGEAGELYTVVMTVTTVLGDTLEGEFRISYTT